jgi:Family of unknown function (DUF5709)
MTDPRHAQQPDLGESIQLDNAETLAGPIDDDPLDSGWIPPDRPLALNRDMDNETFEERLAEDEPDEDEEGDFDPELAHTRLPEAQEYAAEVDAELGTDTEEADDYLPGERAGRLVAPDEGLGPDEEKDMVGTDVGIDGGAASAEEAAIHLEPER